ncbi:MAG: hypothetical protein GXO10_07165 [Crenarchaeota archaeon]|nr:hypothetical protein [Thermoproteota archaeon]
MYSIDAITPDFWRYTFTNKDFSTIPIEKYRNLILDIQKLLVEDIEKRKISARIDIGYSRELGTHVLHFETEDQLLKIYVRPQGVDISVSRVGMKRYRKLVTRLFYLLRDHSLVLGETVFFLKIRVRKSLLS